MKKGMLKVSFPLLLTGCIGSINDTPIETKISNLVNQMTISDTSGMRAFTELISIGAQATPYLICHLGDMRPLAIRGVTLENKPPDAFEAFRHYSPSAVHDAVSIILNQTTGNHFLPVYNGAASQEREENRKQWMDWYNSTCPHQVKNASNH